MLKVQKAFLLALCVWSALAQAAGELPLWEATNARGTVYLFGSIHVCSAACFPLPTAALRRLEASRALVVELDPQRPEAQSLLLDAAMLPAGQSLEQSLPPADWALLKAVAGEQGLPVEILAPMQPWMVSTLLSLTGAQKAGYDVSQGIDLALMQRAAERKLPLEELESVAEQVAALSGGSAREQQEALRLTLEQLRGGRMSAYLGAMIRAWRGGDEASITRLMREGLRADSSYSRGLIEQRNVSMASRIVRSMQDGRTRFVVVGVAHLVGAEGVPALLAKQGYKVRQLREAD